MRVTVSIALGIVAAAFAGCGGGGGGGGDPAALSITTTTLPVATVGAAYDAGIAAAGGTPPYSFRVGAGSLPSGLRLGTLTGSVTGTPTGAGTFPFTIVVSDSADPPGTASRAFGIQVNPPVPPPAYAWAVVSPGGSPPPARAIFAAMADPGGGRMLVTLGSTGTIATAPVHSDSFSLDLSSGSESWSPLAAGPTGRRGHTLVYDSIRKRALLFGGTLNGAVNGNDVWQLTLSGTPAWTQLAPAGTAAPARAGHAAVFDAPNDRMVVFGGGTGLDPLLAPLGDVWSLDFSGGAQGTWSQLLPTGTPPAGRAAMVGVLDSARNRMIVFSGGSTPPAGPQNDTWALDLSTQGSEAWTVLNPAGSPPAVRQYSAGAYDPVRDTMVVFGGENGTSDLGDAWELVVTPGSEAWTALAPSGTAPAARDSHSAAYDLANRRIVFYAGYTRFPSTPYTDVWALNLP